MTKAEYDLLFGKDSVDWRELKVAYENLANAIIESACDSYVNYKIAGDKNQIKSVKNFLIRGTPLPSLPKRILPRALNRHPSK